MNTTTPSISRIVAPTFIAIALGTLVGASALAATFWERAQLAPSDPGVEVTLDRSAYSPLFSDGELESLRPAPPAIIVRRAPRTLAVAPISRIAEAPASVDVLSELDRIAIPVVEDTDREASRAAAVWADGAARARNMGKMDLALDMLRRAVDRAPERHDYWVALAEVQTDRGDSSEAAQSWRKAAELSAR